MSSTPVRNRGQEPLAVIPGLGDLLLRAVEDGLARKLRLGVFFPSTRHLHLCPSCLQEPKPYASWAVVTFEKICLPFTNTSEIYVCFLLQ